MPGDIARPTIVGLLVDVSASMRQSLRNDSKGTLSRLDGWTDALRRAAERAGAAQRTAGDSSVRVFAYAFGTRRIGPVVDLLTLLSIRDRHGAGGGAADPPAPSPAAGGDPYEMLEDLALPHGREGWVLWIEKYLRPDEAAMLAANLRESPRLQKEIAESLPRLSREEFELAEEHSVTKLIFDGTGYAGRAAKLSVKAQLGGYREKAAEAEPIVRKLASRRVTFDELLEERLRMAGATTLTVPELAGLLRRLAATGPADSELTDFLYGATPLTEAVRLAIRRFAISRPTTPKERTTPSTLDKILIGVALLIDLFAGTDEEVIEPHPDTDEILFIISDGASTDGDPVDRLAALRASGTTVVSCYIGATDVVAGVRRLPATASPSWDPGARQLFAYASPVPAGRHRDYLREKGWHIPDGARLFVQANHSDVLSEIAELLLRPR